jgi:hypothetical protein
MCVWMDLKPSGLVARSVPWVDLVLEGRTRCLTKDPLRIR